MTGSSSTPSWELLTYRNGLCGTFIVCLNLDYFGWQPLGISTFVPASGSPASRSRQLSPVLFSCLHQCLGAVKLGMIILLFFDRALNCLLFWFTDVTCLGTLFTIMRQPLASFRLPNFKIPSQREANYYLKQKASMENLYLLPRTYSFINF